MHQCGLQQLCRGEDFAALAEERVIAADLQEKYGSLFTSLLGGEYTDVTDGGDSTIYGQPSSLFVKFAADSFHYLLVSVDTDGNLLSLHETDRTVEPLGEYTSVSRAELTSGWPTESF